jgi:hypothetical protein
MRAVEFYSHLGGQEILQQNKPSIWQEINDVIEAVDASTCRTKVSKEKRKALKGLLYSPVEMNKLFKAEFQLRDWKQEYVTYAVSADQVVLSNPMFFQMTYEQQKAQLEAAGMKLGDDYFRSYNQTDFVKNEVAVEVQFGKYSFVAFDLFVKHLAFYQQRRIAVGMEILPMKELQDQMSSGVPYYEGELFNLARQGRGQPPVPLVVIGIAP